MSDRFLSPLLLFLAATVPAASQTSSLERWIRDLRSAEPSVRAEAACRIGRMGSRGASAISMLVELLPDAEAFEATGRSGCLGDRGSWGDRKRTPGEEAAGALAEIGRASFDPLVGALGSPLWVARKNAAFALGALEDQRAIRPLVPRLSDEMPGVREQAAWALGAIESVSSVDALAKALGDSEPSVREQAAWALGAIGDARPVESLVRALGDERADVREQAAWALGAIGDDRALSALSLALKDESASVREQAAWALGVLGHRQ